jgi:putative mRNA 3-end processing factor
MSPTAKFEDWLKLDGAGLCCAPGGFHVDPTRRVERAIITHGHSDHARPGHGAVLATPQTIAIMRARLGPDAAGSFQELRYGETIGMGGVTVRLVPAGHILGSAQVAIEHRGCRAVVSGDYKRGPDPTAAPFELVRCDLFVTEATFGLPVFRHEPDAREIGRLLASLAAFPERTHLVGAYGLGKTQRLIALLRAAGYDRPIWLHGAHAAMCNLYGELGVDPRAAGAGQRRAEQAAGRDRALPAVGAAGSVDAAVDRSGHGVRLGLDARARARPPARRRAAAGHLRSLRLARAGADDRRDRAEEVWVTHGREDALVHQIGLMGKRGRALALVGFEEEGE